MHLCLFQKCRVSKMSEDETRTGRSGARKRAHPGTTRRNVLAMGGIVASTIFAGSYANRFTLAESEEVGHSGGWGADYERCSHGEGLSLGGIACFLQGTRIFTERGEKAVETLQAGDKLPALSGLLRTVKKVRSWSAKREPGQKWSDDVAPIKVCRSALGQNIPSRDLYLSPLHALYVDGVLIAARNLVNGRSIVRCSDYDAETVTYFHIELDDHQVIWAEGAPVESLLTDAMVPFAPIWSGGRRFELKSRFRSAISPLLDRRTTFDRVRDRIEVRSEANW